MRANYELNLLNQNMKLAAAVPFQYINYDNKNRPNQY